MSVLTDPMLWIKLFSEPTGFINLVLYLLTIFITYGITKHTTDSRWKYILKYHMDDYTKAERAKDLDEIKELTRELSKQSAELEDLRAFRRGVLAMAKPHRKEYDWQETRISTLQTL